MQLQAVRRTHRNCITIQLITLILFQFYRQNSSLGIQYVGDNYKGVLQYRSLMSISSDDSNLFEHQRRANRELQNDNGAIFGQRRLLASDIFRSRVMITKQSRCPGADSIKLFSAQSYTTLEFKHSYWLFQVM